MNLKTAKETIQTEASKKKRLEKNHPSFSDLRDITKPSNIHIIGAPEGGEGRDRKSI